MNSLFTNVPPDDLDFLVAFFNSSEDPFPVNYFIELMRFRLKKNAYKSDGEFYNQNNGITIHIEIYEPEFLPSIIPPDTIYFDMLMILTWQVNLSDFDYVKNIKICN